MIHLQKAKLLMTKINERCNFKTSEWTFLVDREENESMVEKYAQEHDITRSRNIES